MTDDVDEIAVERACKGDRAIRLTGDEMAEAFRRLDAKGVGAKAIGSLLGVSDRAVTRWRSGVAPKSRKAAA